jgi:hypothetical protein
MANLACLMAGAEMDRRYPEEEQVLDDKAFK